MLTFDITTNSYMYVIFTHECNRSCPFCIDRYRSRHEFLSWDSLLKYLDFARTHCITTITVVGGEPTLHPEVVRFCREIKQQGFYLVMTTNADHWRTLEALDGIVDAFNFSYYGQQLPDLFSFSTDITLSVLLWKGRFENLAALDAFITKYEGTVHLKFKAIEVCNQWTEEHCDISELIGQIPFTEHKTLFGAVDVGIYRGIPFGLSVLPQNEYEHAYKGQVNGEITKGWARTGLPG